MKNKKQLLRKKADRLWYLKYLKDACEVCGAKGILQGHHFYYKGSYGYLRYDKDNHITLCKKCHFILHHQDPKKIENIIIEVRGKKWYNRLTKKSKEEHRSFYTIQWLEEQIKKLNE